MLFIRNHKISAQTLHIILVCAIYLLLIRRPEAFACCTSYYTMTGDQAKSPDHTSSGKVHKHNHNHNHNHNHKCKRKQKCKRRVKRTSQIEMLLGIPLAVSPSLLEGTSIVYGNLTGPTRFFNLASLFLLKILSSI